MREEVFLALVTSIVEEAIENLEIPRGPRGQRGARGFQGKDFDFEEHQSKISDLISNSINNRLPELKLKFSDLSDEEKNSLKGKDGKSVKLSDVVSQIINHIEENKSDFSLKFESLTEDQLEKIRGPKGNDGNDGRDGKDVDIEELNGVIHSKIDEDLPKITHLYIDSIKEELVGPQGEKGPRGQRGRSGKDFDFEDSREDLLKLILANSDSLKLKYSDLEESEKEELKLKFKDLSEEEQFCLKLKYSDLTPDEIESLRGPQGEKGPRGQRGKQGIQGERGEIGPRGRDGVDGKQGPMGLPGVQGKSGNDGRDGNDGKDAPKIVDIEVISVARDKIYFKYIFSDGSVIETQILEIPTNLNTYYSFGSGGGSGANGKSAYEIAVDNGFVGTEADWLLSLNGTDGADGANGKSAYEIAVDNGFIGTESQWLDSLKASVEVFDEGVSLGTFGEFNFTGAGVTVTENPVGTVEINIPGGGGGGCVAIEDEYNDVTNCAQSINFIGENVTVRPRTYIASWATMSDVEPSMADYTPTTNPSDVDVYIDFKDPSIITDVDCEASVYVGSFVRMNISGVAINALADSLANSNVLGLVESKQGANKCTIRVSGRSSAIFAGLDPTKEYFLSETIPGGIQTTIPVNTGEVMLRVGQPFSSDSFFYSKGDRVERL